MLKTTALLTILAGCCSLANAKTIAMERPEPMSPEFALGIYQQAAKEKGNLFLSPISMQSALAMTAEGAKGDTAKQFADVLKIGETRGFSNLLIQLQRPQSERNPTKPIQLTIANGLWAQGDFKFDPAYIEKITTQYKAEARALDFSAPDAARTIINQWVEDKTKEKIKNLLAPGTITPQTRLILTNAVYFKGEWALQFTKESTADAPFQVPNAVPSTREPDGFAGKMVPMMQRTGKYGYFDGGDYHMVALPYAGFSAYMHLIIPKEPRGLAKIEEKLNPADLQKAFEVSAGGGNVRRIHLHMPRFKVEQSMSLANALKAMGLTLPFDAEKADFSGMSASDKLAVTDVVHKAWCNVDENGTEAAAATAVIVGVTAAPMEEDPPLEIKADHPFIFVVRDNNMGAILFMGRVSDPMP